jgi:mannose-6-phosphate isomerase-like protein (cupin superfamily)
MEELRTEKLKKINFWDKLLELRDKDRMNKKDAIVNVHAKELPWEINRQGIMRWYLHPIMEDTVINPFIFCVQEIPPGSRSGRVKAQGSQIFYIWEGKGYTVMDGVKHYWEAGDIVQIPLRPMGVIYQHFNGDLKCPVRLISVEANTVGALGMDRGCGFEQLENCPEYENQKSKSKA